MLISHVRPAGTNALPLVPRASKFASVSSAAAQRAVAIRPVPLVEGAEDFPFYSQYPLDRKAEWRSDEGKMALLFAQEDAVLLALSRRVAPWEP